MRASFLPFLQSEKLVTHLFTISPVKLNRIPRQYFHILYLQLHKIDPPFPPLQRRKTSSSSTTPPPPPPRIVRCVDFISATCSSVRDQKPAGGKKEKSWLINGVSLVDRNHPRLGGRTEVSLADKCVPESQGCQARVMGRART